MNKSIQCDGATLAVKTKFVVLSFKPFMFFEKAMYFYKDGKLLFKVPYAMLPSVMKYINSTMDVDYYLELSSQNNEDNFTE